MGDAELDTADALAKLRGGLDRTTYIKTLIAEDAGRCAAELRRLSWEIAREAPAGAPPRPPEATA